MCELPVTADEAPSTGQDETKEDVMSDGPSIGQFSHPVYKQMCLTNGLINRMKKEEIRNNLSQLHLDTRSVYMSHSLQGVLLKCLINF